MSKQGETRKQLERYLRSSHFDFGHHDVSQAKPEYTDKYPELPIQPNIDYGESLGLRKTHFTVGDDTVKDQYKSMYKAAHTHIPHDDAQAKLNEETQKDLRTHHFQYGTQKVPLQSEHQQHFQAQPIPNNRREEQDRMKEMIRKQNIFLGNADTKGHFNSTYQTIYNKEVDPALRTQGLSKQELMDNVVALRKSNIPIGFDKSDYFATEMQGRFKPVPSDYKRAGPPMDLRKTHFEVGTDAMPTESLYKATYEKKPIDKAELNKELLADLRAHHFEIGTKPMEYTSVSAGSYTAPPDEAFAAKGKNPLLWQNHFYLGDTKLNYQTSYKTDLVHKELEKQGKARDQYADRSSSVVFGYDKVQPQSEAKNHFVGFPGFQKTQLEEKTRRDLRESHFKFDAPNHYESYSHAQHKNLLDASKKVNDIGMFKNLANDLSKCHFVLGNDKRELKSVAQETFNRLKGGPSALDAELAKDLRRHHFVLGDDKKKFNDTLYKTEFHWKQPVDE